MRVDERKVASPKLPSFLKIAMVPAFALLSIMQTASSEELGVIEIVYSDGRLLCSTLPYNKPFDIVGDRVAGSMSIDAIVLTIKPAPDGQLDTAQSTWLSSSDTEARFRVHVPPLQTLGEEYEFEFELFMSVPHSEASLERIISKIMAKSELAYKQDKSLSNSEILALFDEGIASEVGQSISARDIKYPRAQLDGSGKIYAQIEDRPHVFLTEAQRLADLLGQALALKSSLESERNALRVIQDELNSLAQKLKSERSKPSPDTLLLRQLSNDSSFLEKGKQELAPRVKQVSDSLSERQKSARAVSRDALQTFLSTRYIHQAKVLVKPPIVGTPADFDRLRFSPVTGYGLALLTSSTRETRTEGALFAALKWRVFGPVDPGARLPYGRREASPFAAPRRLSLVFGSLLTGELEYFGQKLRATGGVMPVAGIGYDFSPQANLMIGGIAFRQPNPNPLATGNSTFRVSLWVSLVFDTDLFNRIRDASKKTN